MTFHNAMMNQIFWWLNALRHKHLFSSGVKTTTSGQQRTSSRSVISLLLLVFDAVKYKVRGRTRSFDDFGGPIWNGCGDFGNGTYPLIDVYGWSETPGHEFFDIKLPVVSIILNFPISKQMLGKLVNSGCLHCRFTSS